MNPTLPPELWLHIHALATEKSSALALSHSECQRFAPRHQDFSKPFNLITQFYQDVHAFTRVCRLWNALATALLYENVVVNEHFPALHKTLEERPNLKHAVRAVRLSPYRLDDNNAILLACPNISVVCQADDSEKSYGHYRAASFDLQRPQIPQTLPSLQILYWVETDQSTGLLQPILQAAPNLKRLFISESPQPATKRVASDLSTVATRLEQLSLGQLVGWDMTRWILALDFSRLTSLECAPGFIEHADFPATLPRLQMLRLSCFRSRIPFARIFARFPALRDLSLWSLG
ncbi:hypothetical protein MIND_01225300 [Mycena indigotica]|uniref:F-box domain-containing protein n=1 Tax=Mycena indigotica TaxID=2126181 RepID=A0A8H6S3D3_9AGAR|nr:uncharacterized protein MIND_01225300 [Mycena indigotica]KAF7291996.1 hypothetical protein MIND_01225300 [Mycena indigotica]